MRPVSSQFLFLKTSALFILWVMLSGTFDLFHLGLGAILSLCIAWINSGHSPFVPNFRIWGKTILYLPWLFGRIVESSIHLAKLILDPKLPIRPRLIRVDTKLQNRAAVVLYGNSITLTPGTITAEIDEHTLMVHAVDEDSSQDVLSGRIESKIADVFGEGKSST